VLVFLIILIIDILIIIIIFFPFSLFSFFVVVYCSLYLYFDVVIAITKKTLIIDNTEYISVFESVNVFEKLHVALYGMYKNQASYCSVMM